MKKILSISLAVLLLFVLCVPAYASSTDTITTDGGTSTGAVTGSYEPGVTGGTVINVEIQWNNLSFTYHGTREAVWDPKTCTYSEPEEAGWNDSNASIVITNRSNTAISAVPEYEATEGYEAAGMDFSTDDLHVISADTGEGGPQTGTITVTPTGYLPEGTSNQTIGHITVTITQADSSKTE